jgi:hypothetical protein
MCPLTRRDSISVTLRLGDLCVNAFFRVHNAVGQKSKIDTYTFDFTFDL